MYRYTKKPDFGQEFYNTVSIIWILYFDKGMKFLCKCFENHGNLLLKQYFVFSVCDVGEKNEGRRICSAPFLEKDRIWVRIVPARKQVIQVTD
jgi:hypothetical protein